LTPDGIAHLSNQAAILMLVNAMHKKFGCEETVEAATEMRNSLTKTKQALKDYTKLLFEDENIKGCMLDAEHPMSEPIGDCFPCEVYRLFRYEDVFFELIKTEDSFDEMLTKLFDAVVNAKNEGFAGLKGHIAERFGFDVFYVSDEEARLSYKSAQAGDKCALRKVYYAMFGQLLQLCAKIDIPIHLHTGTTGYKGSTDTASLDPILMAPFLKDSRYMDTKIVLLHGSFPNTRSASWMAYNFPNVYVDLSQTLLWQGFLAPTILEEALSIAPHDKIMLGTGQHWYCEMVWLASKVAKASLAKVMEDFVNMGLISKEQAVNSSRLILSENAFNMYRK